jgi:hypothetical protein
MAQTAITKALQKIKVNSTIEIRPDIYRDAINDVVKILTDLLPYERETIEAAYEDGNTNLEFGTPNYVHKTDYFTKTYNQ